MIDVTHISYSVSLLTEDKQTLRFVLSSGEKPTVEECNHHRIVGLNLSYGGCAEHWSDIQPMRFAFGTTDKNIIVQRLPKTLVVVEKFGYKVLRTSDAMDDISSLIPAAKATGLIGCWDDCDFIVVASPEYGFIIDSIKAMIIPNHCKLDTNTIGGFMGVNLLLLAC